MRYEGWVPNATGNISFGDIGHALRRGVRYRQQLRTSSKRWIVAAQQRASSVGLMPDALARHLQHDERIRSSRPATSMYILLAETESRLDESEGAVVGTLACLVGDQEAARAVEGKLDALTADLAAQHLLARSGKPSSDPDRTLWAECHKEVQSVALAACHFILLRNGKVIIDSCCGRAQKDPDFLLWVDQLYYFLKDAAHRHFHHSQQFDGIAELTEVGAQPDWRQRTIRGLYRHVLDLRRLRSDPELANALGVLSYADTFRGIFRNCDYDRDGLRSMAPALPAYPRHLVDSLKVLRGEAARAEDERRTNTQFGLGSIVAAGAGMAALFDKLPPHSPAQWIAKSLLNALSHNLLLFPLVVVCLWLLYGACVGRPNIVVSIPFRYIYRAAASLRQRELVLILGAFSILLALVAVMAGYYDHRPRI